uniref:Uncharacterized protein n=1 Tax=Seriola lalandi dorsalis TaxID=1841481 RepID=A0A3B4XUE5_SERLL
HGGILSLITYNENTLGRNLLMAGIDRRLTSRCSSVKITGSATNTRLDSFVIEAERMWELTVRERLRLFRSPIPLSVAFSVPQL